MRKRIKQAVRWYSLTDTALDVAAADVVQQYDIIAGANVFATDAGAVDIGTVRNIKLHYYIQQGATAGVCHLGVAVVNNTASAMDPRVDASNERWMFWATYWITANAIIQPTEFTTFPTDIRVKRKFERSDTLRFWYVNTESSSVMVQARVLLGSGLERR